MGDRFEWNTHQTITSIQQAKNESECHLIKRPRSFFIKGNYQNINKLSREELIVKSCSNVRSKVASSEEFNGWDFKNLYNVPTLFQEKISGKDVRVHICGNNFWSLLVSTKDCLDYRYSTKGSVNYKLFKLPKCVVKFCYSVAKIEKNKFVGIDLMKSKNGYFCLESNPGPGWSTFNHSSKKKFSQTVLEELSKAN